MTTTYAGFEDHVLDDGHHFFVGPLPDSLRLEAAGFEALWAMHPEGFDIIHMLGRPIELPRWQQAYGFDYHFSGRTSSALPVPATLQPFRDWARRSIDERLNGLLLNWYDGALGHYIGPHKDSIVGLISGAPIVTVSLGEGRTFRLSHPELKLKRDFQAEPGTVLITPYDTNLAWKHSVPKFARHRGRRISLTLRAFLKTD